MSQKDEADPSRLRDGADAEAELLASALGDSPDVARREAAMRSVLSRFHEQRGAERVRRWAVAGAALAVAAGAFVFLRSRPPAPKLAAEPRSQSSSQAAPSAARPAPAASASNPLARCAPAAVASGSAPLIDDFEDGDTRVPLNDKRAGNWIAFNDQTGVQTPRMGTHFRADRIAGGRGVSRFGLHTRGGKFSKWGASVAVELSPRRCYDASAYGGIEFWARGRGQIRVMAKMTQVVSEEFGGSCLDDCFDAHVSARKLSSDWQHFTVRWDELAQSGFGRAVVFDPASLYSIEFTVPPDQTPFDFWLDDVAFLATSPAPAQP